MAKILVLDSTIKSPNNELAKDVECQVLKNASQYCLGKNLFGSRSEFVIKGENLQCGWISLRDSSRGPELQNFACCRER